MSIFNIDDEYRPLTQEELAAAQAKALDRVAMNRPEWSVSPGHCEHAEDHEVLERNRICGWKSGICAGPCPSCPNK